MGVIDRTKDAFRSAMSDEVVRSVDSKRSRLPDWEREEDPEAELKPRSAKKPKVSPKRKKASGDKTAKPVTEDKPQRRAISDFDVWKDDGEVEEPRGITIEKNTYESTPLRDEFYDDTSLLDDEDDDSEFDNLTSLDDEPAEAWDPETVSLDDDTEVAQDSSDLTSPAELPQSTAFENDMSIDLDSQSDSSSNSLDEAASEPLPTPSEPSDSSRLEDDMTDIDLDELPEAPEKSSYELIQEHSEAPLDLSRAISLEALDQIVFPTDTEGYNRANVDAMMGFLRLSLSLYIRQAERLEGTITGLASELEERTGLYAQARAKLEASVPVSDLRDAEADRDHLTAVVRDLASQLGVDANELIGGNEAQDEVLVFRAVASSPSGAQDRTEEPDEVQPPEDEDKPDDSDDEILSWGSLK